MTIESSSASEQKIEPLPGGIRLLRVFLWVLIPTMLLPIIALRGIPTLARKVELVRPSISIPQSPFGIGEATRPYAIRVRDSLAGVRRIVVRIENDGKVRTLADVGYSNLSEVDLSIGLGARSLKLTGPKAILRIEASDGAIWGNTSSVTIPMVVDTAKPIISVLAQSDPAIAGNSRVIGYKVEDPHTLKSGIVSGENEFLGHPAWSANTDFNDPTVYFAVGATTKSLTSNPDLKLFAQDIGGNASDLSLTSAPQQLPKTSPVREVLSDDFMQKRVRILANHNLPLLQAKSKISTEEYAELFLSTSEQEELSAKFNLTITKLRDLNETQLRDAESSTRLQATLTDHFVPPAGDRKVTFGQEIIYDFHNRTVGVDHSTGWEIVTSEDAEPIFAANDGTVAFADELGAFGSTVTIDHGLGIVSTYKHLRSTLVQKNDVVRRGQRIGFAGNSGISQTNGVFFEIRLSGVPVDPTEWCDPGLFFRRFTSVINAMRTKLGLPTSSTLDWGRK